MNRLYVAAALIAVPLLLTPIAAYASCAGRKSTGTVVGGVGGALIGNSISGGGGGAILGGLGGAVLGHEVAKGGCRDSRYVSHYDNRYHHSVRYSHDRYGHRVAVDRHGNPL
jgi:uncharacterized protein YcfJ